jgi:hypothetical protein
MPVARGTSRAGAAELLYEAMEAELSRRGASLTRLREIADDTVLIAFARERGFQAREQYELDGTEIVVLTKDLQG